MILFQEREKRKLEIELGRIVIFGGKVKEEKFIKEIKKQWVEKLLESQEIVIEVKERAF